MKKLNKMITNSEGNVAIIALLILVLLLVGFVLFKDKLTQFLPQINKQVATPEVATDPNIVAVEGQLAEGFPEFPVYPQAKLIQSAQLKKDGSVGGYRAEWELTGGDVSKIMEWYVKELTSKGWVVQPPDDPKAYGEQIATATKNNQVAYLRIELHEQGIIEIEVDIPPK